MNTIEEFELEVINGGRSILEEPTFWGTFSDGLGLFLLPGVRVGFSTNVVYWMMYDMRNTNANRVV